MGKFFKDLKAGLEEALDHEKGKKTCPAETIDFDDSQVSVEYINIQENNESSEK
ncbi:MAG: hypothetical protein K1000chlam4_00420 [Chlamydiae bacterium]|nr:hypothetical protein [Chlamydiota bacterium]